MQPGARRARVLDQRRGDLALTLVHVGDVEHRLARSAPGAAWGIRAPSRDRHVAHRARLGRAPRPPLAAIRSATPPGRRARLLSDPLETPLACSRSASRSSVPPSRRRPPGRLRPRGGGRFSSAWAADHVADRVGLADLGQETIAEPLAPEAPCTSPAMSAKLIVSGTPRARPDHARDARQARVGNRRPPPRSARWS